MKTKKGAALVTVVVIFLFVSIVAMVVYNYSVNNLQQAKKQEENIRAYYLAYSGCEMAYAALLKEASGTWGEYVKKLGDKEQTLTNADLGSLTDKDSIHIKVKKSTDAKLNNWVEISAEGKSHYETKYFGEKTVYLYVHPEKPERMVWR